MLAHSGPNAEDEIAVGREALRPVDHLLDADLRPAPARAMACSMCCSKWSKSSSNRLELPVVGHVALGPGLRVGLIAAQDEAADLFLEIGEAVRVADGRRVGGQPGIFSVMTYWCFTGCSGTLTPAIAPTCRAHCRRS
jgi:hypothetical protein